MIERRVAVVLVVDRHGRLLMQHRDARARTSPNQWAFPGGSIEPGEQPHEAAARELHEETGLSVDELVPYGVFTRPSVTDPAALVEVHVYTAATDAEQDEVVLGEGQAMLFRSPQEAVKLDLGVTARMLLPGFFDTPRYAELSTTR